MYRILIDKIIYNLDTEYMNWLEDRPKLERYGYKLTEKSTKIHVAEKEYTLPFDINMLEDSNESDTNT